jgi:hypothetical protein
MPRCGDSTTAVDQGDASAAIHREKPTFTATGEA